MSSGHVGRWLLIVAALVMAATVVAALWVTGSPQAQRQVRLDEKREYDLARIFSALDSHAKNGHPLPAGLQALARQPRLRLSITDPVQAKPTITAAWATTATNCVPSSPLIPRSESQSFMHSRSGSTALAGIASGVGLAALVLRNAVRSPSKSNDAESDVESAHSEQALAQPAQPPRIHLILARQTTLNPCEGCPFG
ncbi:MAG TPA: hypothetical protein VK325_08225 [Pseudoxanthomonas sp.]|nr:hypothetical protein [Pseudoxanthomonas sp.]